MERGARAAQALLLEIRARGNDASPAIIVGLIEASAPLSGPARIGFLMVVAEYLTAALAGCPVDPEELSVCFNAEVA